MHQTAPVLTISSWTTVVLHSTKQYTVKVVVRLFGQQTCIVSHVQSPNKHRSMVFDCTVLYCTVLYCTVLHCTVLYCTVLYCTVLYCTVLYCTVLHHFHYSPLAGAQHRPQRSAPTDNGVNTTSLPYIEVL